MYHSDDVVERLGVHRIATAFGLGHFVGRLLHGQVSIEADHLGARGHHVLRHFLGEFEHPFDEPGVLLRQPAAFLALLAPRLRSREPLAVALGAGAVALIVLPFVPAGIPLLIVAVLVAGIGFGRRSA